MRRDPNLIWLGGVYPYDAYDDYIRQGWCDPIDSDSSMKAIKDASDAIVFQLMAEGEGGDIPARADLEKIDRRLMVDFFLYCFEKEE